MTARSTVTSMGADLEPLLSWAAREARVLGVDKVEASAVLDLQWGRMTRAQPTRIADDRERQERELAD